MTYIKDKRGKKYIRLNLFEVEHLHELALQNFQYNCAVCELIQDKLEKFLGKKTTNSNKKIISQHPYPPNKNKEVK